MNGQKVLSSHNSALSSVRLFLLNASAVARFRLREHECMAVDVGEYSGGFIDHPCRIHR